MNTLRRTLSLLFAVLLLTGLLSLAGLTVAAEGATSGEQEYQTADTSALKFCATSLTLNSKISLNFYVRQEANEAFAGHLRVNAVIDGTTTVQTVYSTATINGVAYYRFAVTGLTPESIGRTVTANLYVDGNDTPVNTYSYSILQYLKNKYDPNTTLGQLCLSLAYYGGAFGANVDSFFEEKGITRDESYYTDYSAEVGMTYAVDPTSTGLAGVQAVLEDGVRLMLAVDERVKSATVTYNGKTTAVKEIIQEANGTRGFYVQLPATSLNGQVSVTTYTGTDARTGAIGSATYSVGSYVAKLVSTSTDAKTVAKAQALARYMGATTGYSGVGTENAKLDATAHSVEYIPAPASAAGNNGANYVLRVVDGNMAAAVPVRLSEDATENDANTNLYKFKDAAVVGNADNTESGITLPKTTQVHTLTFHYKNASGGDMTASRNVLHGGYATAPFAPATYTTVDGTYTFIGWFTAEDGQTQADFSTINADADIYACYTAEAIKTHKVTFVGRGGQVIAVLTVRKDGTVSAPTAPALKFMTFDGWTDGLNTYTSAQIAGLAVTANRTFTATYTRFNPIYKQKDLANLKNAASGSFWGLMGDIEVDNTWASVVLPAGVTFTGDGHTISGLTKPLFSTITGDNTIKNLTLETAAVEKDSEGNVTGGGITATTSIGILASKATGNLALMNVTVKGYVKTSDARSSAGGFIGEYTGAAGATLSFIGCVNEANVVNTTASGDYGVGGFLGKANAASKMASISFSGCINNGVITADSAAQAGGIVGYGIKYGDLTIDNCQNNNSVTSIAGKAGGLVGSISSGSSSNNAYLKMTYSTNSGAVSGVGYVGGLIGRVHSPQTKCNIENSVNVGAVSGTGAIGGLVGGYESPNNTSVQLYIRNSASHGNVTATSGVAAAILGEANILSGASSTPEIVNCYAGGTVAGDVAVAAVIGNITGAASKYTTAVPVTHCVLTSELVCTKETGQKAALVAKYSVSPTKGYATLESSSNMFSEALATEALWYDINGSIVAYEGDLATGTAYADFLNAAVATANEAGTYAASGWVETDGKLVPRNTAYTYYFYGASGLFLYSHTVDVNAHVTTPKTGTGEGAGVSDRAYYYITGWTIDGIAADFAKITTNGDKIVIASAYKPYQYQIKFVNASGGNINNNIYVEYGSTVTATQLATVKAPTVEGKVFVGWTTGGKLYTNEEVLTQVIIKAATTFTATYVDEMVVTFQDADGVEIATRKTPVNGTIVAPDDPVKDGHSFLGWTTDDGATLVSKADIDQLIVTNSVTYKAVFVPLSITVIFKDGDTVLSEEEVDWGTTLTPPALETPAGMVFVGWLADNDSVTYTAADFEGDDAYVATSSVTFTAVWGEVTTVTFIDEHYTSDAGDHVWATQTIGRGGKATVPATPTNYAGMTFVGWSDGTNTYSEAELADLVINQDTTFTAFYTNVTYTVTFKNNDGKVYTTATVGDGACAIAPEPPVKVMPASIPSDCFKFAGWTYKGEAWNFDTPVTGDMELVAAYEFDANNASGVIGISDMEGLKAIDQNKIYVLTDDIDMTGWQTISLGSYSTYSTEEKTLGKIILCGDGHKLTNLTANLFQFVSYDMDIMNLVVEEPTISLTGSNAVASVFMQAFRANNLSFTDVSIKNCNLEAAYIGGFVCDFYNNVTFTRCTITGTLTGGPNNAAGVGAFTNNANASPSNKKLASDTKQSTIKFDGCISNVEIISKNYSIRYAGALISNNTLMNVEIEATNCTLNTVITVTASKTVENYGSIVGYFKASVAGTSLNVDGCTVTGTYKGNPIKVISENGGTPATYIITNTTNNGESADTE